MIGFAGIWQVIPVTAFLHARVYRLAKEPVLRIAALSSLVTYMTVVVQMWGDVGLSHLMVNVMLGAGIGAAARLPILSGAWPSPQSSKQAATKPGPNASQAPS
jgi:hypothetical protein